MNKKAFTLVELLGVIVIISIILIVTVPSLLNSLKKIGSQEYNAFLNNLYTATETYVETNRNRYPELNSVGGKVFIPIQELIDEDLIKKMGTDPDTGELMPTTYTVVATTQSDKTINYSLLKKDTNIDSYAQNGLLLHYDGINNTGLGHSFTSTKWYDLSDSHNDVTGVTPAKWSTKGLTFDGYYLSSQNVINPATLGKNVTIEIVLLSNTYKLVEIGVGSNIALKLRPTGANPWWNCYPITVQSYSSNYQLNQIQSFVYVNNFSGSTASKWYNGVKTSASVSDITQASYKFNLGTGENLLGNIYAIRVYNRALTDEEILNNYNLDRNRFEF